MAREWLRSQFTFTHPDDVRRYGSLPYLYDERELVSLSARQLMQLEEETGLTVRDMINGLRDSVTAADLAIVWWSLRQVREVPPLAEFDVHTMLIEWQAAPADMGKEQASSADTEPLPTSEPAPMISLPTLPRAE